MALTVVFMRHLWSFLPLGTFTSISVFLHPASLCLWVWSLDKTETDGQYPQFGLLWQPLCNKFYQFEYCAYCLTILCCAAAVGLNAHPAYEGCSYIHRLGARGRYCSGRHGHCADHCHCDESWLSGDCWKDWCWNQCSVDYVLVSSAAR